MFNFFTKKKHDSIKLAEASNTTNTSQTNRNDEHWANRKGELGEYKIDIRLDRFPKNYKYISDLMLKNPYSSTGYSQVDHLIISPYGVFVIETKNYQGTIYGGKDRKTWLVNGKFKMMSPLVQNYGHIQAIKNFIDSKYHDFFISIVSFTKRSTLKIDEDLGKIQSNELVIYDIELTEFITRKVSINKVIHKEPFFSDEIIESIYLKLKENNITDSDIRKQHVEKLRNKKDESTTSSEYNQCVICHKAVSTKVKEFCLSNKRFNGNVYCYDHQKDVK